jgi:outer membrane protein OmpA-like peptidoglycan-associated protein
MPARARLLALRLAAGSLLPGPAVAEAAPSGDAGGEAEAALGVEGLRARGKKAKTNAGKASKTAGEAVENATGDDGSLSKRTDRPWVQRWAPERNMLELGVFGGMLIPARDLELFEPRRGRPRQGFLPLAILAPEVGVRVGYFPLRFLGIEAEGASMPTSTLEEGYGVQMWAARGHLVGQLPFASIAPFVVVGAGVLGMSSQRVVLGNDVDQAFHLGIGTKIFINRRLSARLDLRDVISPRRGINGGATNSIEVLLGLSLTLGRQRDRDEAPAPEPPPPAPRDGDGDGFLDGDDACPAKAGVAPDGCPAPDDPDGDGFLAGDDACPEEAGVAPDGCPDRDADRDGVLIPDDACPDEPEAINGFDDGDGCPDEVPDAVKEFTGRLEGVNFELNRATLTKASLPALDEAVKVLLQFPSIRIEVSGHTDNSGGRDTNMRLSQERAEAVMKYLVEHGVEAGRIITRGAGPDEPIESNATREGRASNRRIEFRVLE